MVMLSHSSLEDDGGSAETPRDNGGVGICDIAGFMQIVDLFSSHSSGKINGRIYSQIKIFPFDLSYVIWCLAFVSASDRLLLCIYLRRLYLNRNRNPEPRKSDRFGRRAEIAEQKSSSVIA